MFEEKVFCINCNEVRYVAKCLHVFKTCFRRIDGRDFRLAVCDGGCGCKDAVRGLEEVEGDFGVDS